MTSQKMREIQESRDRWGYTKIDQIIVATILSVTLRFSYIFKLYWCLANTNNGFPFIRISERLNQRQEKFIRLTNSQTNCPVVRNHADCRHRRGRKFPRHTFHNERVRIQSFSWVRHCTYATVQCFFYAIPCFRQFSHENAEQRELRDERRLQLGNFNLFLATSVSQMFLTQFPLHKVCKITDLLIVALRQITKIIHL